MTNPSLSPLPPKESPLNLVIIGAGLCGLAAGLATRLAGHNVTILEAIASPREVGAGLQLTPNGTRLLSDWGVSDMLAPLAVNPETFTMYRYDGDVLARRSDIGTEIYERYGSPLWCVHRADLQQVMMARAVEIGVNLRLGAKAELVDVEGACVELVGGEVVSGDLVLAADGLWSGTRDALLGNSMKPKPKPKPTGDLAYRFLLDRDSIEDAELREWSTRPGIHVWIGPGVHAVEYGIKGGRWLNFVLLVPDDLPADVARARGDRGEMMKIFEGWDPILTRFLKLTSKVEKWRLNHLDALPSWKTADGHFIVAGDCAHPMLPYLAQGTNCALEDGATIGGLLAKCTRKEQIAPAMAMYEAIRRPRVEKLLKEVVAHGREHHLPDGKQQRKRDEFLKLSMQKTADGGDSAWAYPKVQPWLFSHDAYEAVEIAYAKHPF